MFIYFRLILCLLNPFVRLERFDNYTLLQGSDLFLIKKYRNNKLLSIKIIKSTGEQSHKEWYFKPRFK